MATILLSDLIDEYEESMKANGYAKRTIINNIRASRLLLAEVGNIQARHVTSRHIDQFFAKRKSQKLKASSLNVDLNGIRQLFKYARHRRCVPAGADPTAHRRPFKSVPSERLRLPASEFPGCWTQPCTRGTAS